MEGVGAIVLGWFGVGLSGVYLAMLTLAFAQIVWSIVFQWDSCTGGSNGVIGLWPPGWLSGNAYSYFALVIVTLAALALPRLMFSPFGYALRSRRASSVTADAVGRDGSRVQWSAL